jgi:hypothetical protein
VYAVFLNVQPLSSLPPRFVAFPLSFFLYLHTGPLTIELTAYHPSPATRPNTRTRPTGRDPLPQHRPPARIRTRNRNITLLLPLRRQLCVFLPRSLSIPETLTHSHLSSILHLSAIPRRRTPPSSSRRARAPKNTARRAPRGGGTLLRGNTAPPRRAGAV